MRADARGHQRLVGVAKSRVGNQEAFFFSRPGGKFLGSEPLEELARSWRRIDAGERRESGSFQAFGDLFALYFGITVKDHVAQIRKQLCRTVAAALQSKQLGRFVEKRGG